MNDLDKAVFKALRFFANHTTDEVSSIYNEKINIFRKNVPQHIERHISESKYISPHEVNKYMITREGQIELRKLEEINSRDKDIFYSAIAIIISLLALMISLYGGI